MEKTIIEFVNVTKTYKIGEISIDAVKNASFKINDGEFVIILGASGAGKSTILNLLGGMDKATSGQILVNNEDIVKYNDKQMTKYRRNNIGFVFQFYNLISNLTALENVEFASEVSPNPLNPKEIVNLVGLSERENNFPTQLSGGEQQRVAIARAIAKNPLLLLCDEPTGALDYVTGKKILKLLEDINVKYGKTIVLITHNSMIAPMADKIIRVRSGEIESISLNENKQSVDGIEW